MEDYRTIRGTANGEYEEKKSRFIAQLSFAEDRKSGVGAEGLVAQPALDAGGAHRQEGAGQPEVQAGHRDPLNLT